MKKSFLKVFTAIVFAVVATSCGSGLGKWQWILRKLSTR